MSSQEHDRTTPKEPLTIRFNRQQKEALSQMAKEQNRTVSALVQEFVRQGLEGLPPLASASEPKDPIKVRHAALPDTSVMRAFQECAPERFQAAVSELELPRIEFVENRPEWRRLPSDLYSGESDVIESMNLAPIFKYVTQGRSSSEIRHDWVGPFLQIFVGHAVFVREDFLSLYLDQSSIESFREFRAKSRTGRDLSTRSLVAWVQSLDGDRKNAAQALETMWTDAVVGCQTGTDYHIAVRRVAPILAQINDGRSERFVDPTITDIDQLDRGFQEFRSGAVDAFTGNLLHTATLLAESAPMAALVAGPADLRVPSLNTLAGRKGMFDMPPNSRGDALEPLGNRILALWGQSVSWFRDQVINAESDEPLSSVIAKLFPESLNATAPSADSQYKKNIAVLRSLMQSWVKWFSNPDDACAFVGDPKEALSKYYAKLCEKLNPLEDMPAPHFDDQDEQALWKFPTFPKHIKSEGKSTSRSGGSPSN